MHHLCRVTDDLNLQVGAVSRRKAPHSWEGRANKGLNTSVLLY
jgi:hypothetical protein